MTPLTLELLAPARDAACGIAAIDHGADAVYIGGPAFGARAAAGNPVTDIERLAAHAHRYHARVYVALNTLLYDDELETARRLAHQLWNAGADALIVQDMGLLELDLPPIALHASTQTDNRTPEKVRFLEQAGFSQVVLARELTLDEIAAIAARTSVTLEAFVHGALCVSYSGQCYLSQALTGRSANRGECAQPCRLPATLRGADGEAMVESRHLLSLKDLARGDALRAMVDAGVRSFKIEGRLKDIAYVKNVTAWYRQRLDELLAELPQARPASSGRCHHHFTPQPEKSFNRGLTDYFLRARQPDILAERSPKFVGEPVGRVARSARDHFELDATTTLHNGDGLSWFDAHDQLAGVRVNRVDGRRVYPAEAPPWPAPGTPVYRNRDQHFERLLEKDSAERRIGADLHLAAEPGGFRLTIRDRDGIVAEARLAHDHQPASQPERALAAMREQLGKLGNTAFVAEAIDLDLPRPLFLPAAALNALRRDAVARLETARLAAYRRPPRAAASEPPAPYPESALTYLGNVANRAARAFYARHGVRLMAAAYETGAPTGAVPLMITRHCLRYSYRLCPKQKTPDAGSGPLTLELGGTKLTLEFDCRRCEMRVIGRARRP